MRQKFIVAGILILASATVLLALEHSTRTYGAMASRRVAHLVKAPVTSFNDAKITATCDRLQPEASLGLSKPTLVSRIDGVDAIIFATGTEYSACIIYNSKDVATNKPTQLVHDSAVVDELESFGTLKKVPGGEQYVTDTWFVVRTSSTVSTLKSVTRGTSQVSDTARGFAFIHDEETADVHGKFSYGLAAGFSAGGELVGSATLR